MLDVGVRIKGKIEDHAQEVVVNAKANVFLCFYRTEGSLNSRLVTIDHVVDRLQDEDHRTLLWMT